MAKFNGADSWSTVRGISAFIAITTPVVMVLQPIPAVAWWPSGQTSMMFIPRLVCAMAVLMIMPPMFYRTLWAKLMDMMCVPIITAVI